MLKDLSKYEHTVLYYGPYSVDELASVIEKKHRTAGKLAPVPAGKEYTEQQTTENEIMIAPYEAKNAYISQYCNNGRKWSAEKQPVVEIFNEYFGGGMNSVVFQELRRSRGLDTAHGQHTTRRGGRTTMSSPALRLYRRTTR